MARKSSSRAADIAAAGGAGTFSRVYVASADGTKEQLIADGDGPSWSYDGNLIACCQYDPAYPAPIVRVVDRQKGRQRFIGFGWYRPNWSSDSSTVALNGFTTMGQRRLVRIKVELTGEPKPPEQILLGVEHAYSPHYSKDGKYVVFIAKRAAEDTQQEAERLK